MTDTGIKYSYYTTEKESIQTFCNIFTFYYNITEHAWLTNFTKEYFWKVLDTFEWTNLNKENDMDPLKLLYDSIK